MDQTAPDPNADNALIEQMERLRDSLDRVLISRGEYASASDLEAERTESPRGDFVWLGTGLLAFGIVTGVTVGWSESKGISQALLTGLLTFVSGTLLGYVGFHRAPRHGESESRVDIRRVGMGLTMLSLGIILGLNGGFWTKRLLSIHDQAVGVDSTTAEGGQTRASSTEKLGALPVGLQYDKHSTCDAFRQRLQNKGYETGTFDPIVDLETILDAHCPPATSR